MGGMILTVSCLILFVFPTIGYSQTATQERQVFSVIQVPLKLTLKKVSIAEIFDESYKEELQIEVWSFLERTDGKSIYNPTTNRDNVTIGITRLFGDGSQEIPSNNGVSTMYRSTDVHPEDRWVLFQGLEFSDDDRLLRGSLRVKKKDIANLSKLNIHVYLTLTNPDKKPEPLVFVFEGIQLPARY
ncbi:MAG: hypothetical protein GXO99_04755 [Nitrospirae bacterium]|nr:hypothetical protein [Nitrospirota bacterium]